MIKCWYWGARSFTAEGNKKGDTRGVFWLYHVCLVTQMCPTLCDPMDCSPPGFSVHGDSPGKNTGVGCHALLQGIFPTQDWTQVSHTISIFFMIWADFISSPPKQPIWLQREKIKLLSSLSSLMKQPHNQVHLASHERHEVPLSMAPSNQALWTVHCCN